MCYGRRTEAGGAETSRFTREASTPQHYASAWMLVYELCENYSERQEIKDGLLSHVAWIFVNLNLADKSDDLWYSFLDT